MSGTSYLSLTANLAADHRAALRQDADRLRLVTELHHTLATVGTRSGHYFGPIPRSATTARFPAHI